MSTQAPDQMTNAGQMAVPAPPDGHQEIATLPPLDELGDELPLSPATGQPRRSKVMVGAMLLLYAAAAVSAVALCKAWWDAIHMHSFMNSVKLIEWWQPRPGGWRSIVAVVAMFAIGTAMTAAPAISGFQAWNGHRWSRWTALASAAICAGCLAMNTWSWPALPLALLGALALWLPAVGRYFSHWEHFRAGQVLPVRPTPDRVVYGPLPRYR